MVEGGPVDEPHGDLWHGHGLRSPQQYVVGQAYGKAGDGGCVTNDVLGDIVARVCHEQKEHYDRADLAVASRNRKAFGYGDVREDVQTVEHP